MPVALAAFVSAVDMIESEPPEINQAAQQKAAIEACWHAQHLLDSDVKKRAAAKKCTAMEIDFKVMHEQTL